MKIHQSEIITITLILASILFNITEQGNLSFIIFPRQGKKITSKFGSLCPMKPLLVPLLHTFRAYYISQKVSRAHNSELSIVSGNEIEIPSSPVNFLELINSPWPEDF